MINSEWSENLIEMVALGAVKNRSAYEAIRDLLKRIRILDDFRARPQAKGAWLKPPNHAKREIDTDSGALLIYPRLLTALATPVMRRVIEDVRLSHGRLFALGDVDYRQFDSWLAIDPLYGSVKVAVYVGQEVLGYVSDADIADLTQAGAHPLPVFGRSVVVPAFLIGSGDLGGSVALRFALPG